MLDTCPIWSLDDLYSGVDSTVLQSDIATCRAEATQLETEWRAQLGAASASQLVEVIYRYEMILERLGKVQSHAQLLFASNTNDPIITKHHQSVREVGAEIAATLLFVELELAKIDEEKMVTLLKDTGLQYFHMVEAGASLAPFNFLMKLKR